MWTEQADGLVVPATPGALAAFVDAVCQQLGAEAEVAAEVAGHLVGANLAGHDSHGVLRLAQYVAERDRGELVPSARPSVSRRHGACLLLDGHQGFGHYAARLACDLAAQVALEQGIAAVAIRHAGHIGRLGHYCELLANTGLVSLLVMGAVGPDVGVMAPPGTSRRFLAANPWALGVPAADEPVIVDVSMAMLAEGKVSDAATRGARLPEGCVLDAVRRPSQEPADYFAGGCLLPLGSPVAAHKGFGLALGAALLGGLAVIGDDRPTLAGTQRPPWSAGIGEMAGVCLVAIDPEAFGGRDDYRVAITTVIDSLTHPGDDATVTVPGTPESHSRRERAESLMLPAAVVNGLNDIGTRFGVPLQLAT